MIAAVVVEPLRPKDDRRGGFRCGVLALDDFIQRHAARHYHDLHLSVTLVCNADDALAGFITTSAGAFKAADLGLAGSWPSYNLPTLHIARLAVDERHRRKGFAEHLLGEAVVRAREMQDLCGCVAVTVDAKAPAVPFYAAFGFVEVPSPRSTSFMVLTSGKWS